jgi:ferredoxin
MLTLKENQLDEFFALIEKKRELYLPVENKTGKSEYKRWADGDKYSTALRTVKSAKNFFFAKSENLYDLKMDNKNVEVIDTREDVKEFVIFGVRACDVKSFDILDNVYLQDPVDTYYKNRRDHGLVISMACSKPATTCFCALFDIDATSPNGDIQAWHVDDKYYFNPLTAKGDAFVEEFKECFSEEDDAPVEKQKAETLDKIEKLPFVNLNMEGFGVEEKLKAIFDRPEWEDLSSTCIGCGTCTYVCPTCQCFDIKDFKVGDGSIKRFRCWDSCMYSDFTKMAAANPRLTQTERFRQRFMHKLVYYPIKNEGIYGCVGCGRCLVSCPVQMNIVKVIKAMGDN